MDCAYFETARLVIIALASSMVILILTIVVAIWRKGL